MLTPKATLRGVPEMVNKLKAIAKNYPDQVGGAIYAEAQIEMTESKRRCPVSPVPAPKGVVPGTLRASGRVSLPERNGRDISVVLSYGGAADYAVVQHERLDFFHTTGQAKYLESVLNESRPFMASRIAKRVHLDKVKV